MRTDGVITPTRVELGHRCYRRHAVSDILERGLYKSPSAGFGNVIHSGAAAHWRGESVDEAVSAEYERVRNEMNDKHSLELALAMMDNYKDEATLAGPFSADNYKVVTIEERLQTQLGGFDISFQLDRLLALGTEKLLLVDTKSAARLDQRWRSQWNRSLQFKLYKACIQKVYEMPVDIVIEGLLKTPKSKIEYYVIPEWDDDTLDEAVRERVAIAEKDRQLIETLINDEGEGVEFALTQTTFNAQDCFSYNVECPFLKLCDSPPSIRKAILDAEYMDIPGDY